MSAFLVSKAHIDSLVAVALIGPANTRPDHTFSYYTDTDSTNPKRHELRTGLDEDMLGRMLWTENLKSINARYPDCTDDDMPGPIGVDHESIATYTFPHAYGQHYRLTAVAALKAIDCYEYQSCEHQGWATSDAKAFCDTLRRHCIHKLDGYDDAKWTIEAPKAQMVSKEWRRII